MSLFASYAGKKRRSILIHYTRECNNSIPRLLALSLFARNYEIMEITLMIFFKYRSANGLAVIAVISSLQLFRESYSSIK